MAPLDLSIIIPTHNRSADIQRTLDALATQTFPADRFEVIVVADGCQDDTATVVSNYHTPFRLRLLEQPGSGPAQARNLGASLAKGRLILFLDDDIEATSDLVAAHVASHGSDPGGSVVIGYLPTVLHGARDWFRAGLRRWWEDNFIAMGHPGHRFSYTNLLSGNFSIEASRFMAVGGFDTRLRCREDYEFGMRVLKSDMQFRFAPEAKGYHHERTDLDRSLKRKEQEGKADIQLGRLHPELRQTLLVNRLFWCCIPAEKPLGLFVFVTGNRIVRALALGWPRGGNVLANYGRRMMDILERLQLRRGWSLLSDSLRAYWYWRGVATELPTIAAIERFLNEELSETLPGEVPVVDLNAGLVAAEQWLDQERPAHIEVKFREYSLGRLPALPGAERLRGVHLRTALATSMANLYLAALATENALVGNTVGHVPRD